ncbi:hypothetical protein [Peribacillus frigoritolerans]|uniref:hypothetical protein n=1 Tax=Peribacillus frigoritolerans TaxID=450367 RepID=UPI0007BF1B36|nr:hypothetical protein [Peribacillus frigoritolerans]
MKLEFEKYLESQSFSEESMSIISEGIKCYKIGAYRASFLMSYYFFLKVLKDRLEQSRHAKPDTLDLSTWQGLLQKVNDDTVWDQTVFETTQWKLADGRSKIYLINNDLREDMVYWRRKRNDCAHSKDNIISYPHVESFWLFIQSNLNKFIVNGGREALLDKFKIHFDPKYTKPGLDYKYLIQPIPLVVGKRDIGELLKDIDEILEEKSSYYYIDNKKSVYYYFWNDISCSSNEDINKGFIDFITSSQELFIKFITVYPEKFLLCTSNTPLIREFWKEKFISREVKSSDAFWDLAITLLRNNIIDESEKNKFVRKLALAGQHHKLKKDHMEFLRSHGLFKCIKSYLFEGILFTQPFNGYNNANASRHFILFYLKNEPLDEVVVESLNSLFKGLAYGDFREAFIEFMKDNPEFVKSFIKIAENKGLNLASIFKEEERIEAVETTEATETTEL